MTARPGAMRTMHHSGPAVLRGPPRPRSGLSLETFRGMVLLLRGRTGLSQRELAACAGLHWHSIQGWESGANYPSARSLRALIAAYLGAGGFARGREASEAAALWSAALDSAPRLRTPLDPDWLAALPAQGLALPGPSDGAEATASGLAGLPLTPAAGVVAADLAGLPRAPAAERGAGYRRHSGSRV